MNGPSSLNRSRPRAPAAALPAAALAAVALASAVAGCGTGASVDAVRVLQLHPGALVGKERSAARPAPASLRAPVDAAGTRQSAGAASAAAGLPPAMIVPRVGSVAVGAPNAGRLVRGLQLPATGPDWVTYDPVLQRVPNRPERRWGTDRLLAFLLFVLRDYRLANPGAPPVVVGDLSRPHGGPFGARFGGLGHASHQNGLDADVYYPRRDRLALPPTRVREVDGLLAQDLVSRFVGAGARFAFVGLRVGVRGPRHVVQAIPYHDDHVHVRVAGPGG